MAGLITTLKDKFKTVQIFPRTKIKALLDENNNAVSQNVTASDLNACANGAVSGKEDKEKLTIAGTTYTIRQSTTDQGAAGYITFVTES